MIDSSYIMLDSSSGSYKYTYEVDCKHKQHLVNQGITFCFVGDIRNCDTCPFKSPETYESTISWASICSASTEDE